MPNAKDAAAAAAAACSLTLFDDDFSRDILLGRVGTHFLL